MKNSLIIIPTALNNDHYTKVPLVSAATAAAAFRPKALNFDESKFWATGIMVLLLLVGLPIRGAWALSQAQVPQNVDGTPKFTDPDEQMPGFVVGPQETGHETAGFSDSASTVTVPIVGDRDYGAQAFDQAFSHQQSKE